MSFASTLPFAAYVFQADLKRHAELPEVETVRRSISRLAGQTWMQCRGESGRETFGRLDISIHDRYSGVAVGERGEKLKTGECRLSQRLLPLGKILVEVYRNRSRYTIC